MISYIILAVSAILFILYILKIRKENFTTKKMVTVAMFSAISFVLYLIEFIKFPQGGGLTLFSMLPTMLLSLLYGNTLGLTSGMLFGLLKLLKGVTFVNPAQFLLDYIFATMALGLAGTFGNDNKLKVALGSLMAVVISVFINVLSGAVYFGQYAPKGMNVWFYSFIYNISYAGLEGVLCVVILLVLPLKRLKVNE